MVWKLKDQCLKAKLSTEISDTEEVSENEPQVQEPVKEEKPRKEEPAVVKTYIVVKGDSLWKIAKIKLGDGRRYIEFTI